MGFGGAICMAQGSNTTDCGFKTVLGNNIVMYNYLFQYGQTDSDTCIIFCAFTILDQIVVMH